VISPGAGQFARLAAVGDGVGVQVVGGHVLMV
jgi:hypothetical protein